MRPFLDAHGRLVLAGLATAVLLVRCSVGLSSEEPEAAPVPNPNPPAAVATAPLGDCAQAKASLRAANGTMAYVFAHALPSPAPTVGDASSRVTATTRSAPQTVRDDARVVVAGLSAFDAAARTADGNPEERTPELLRAQSAVEDPAYVAASARLSSWWEDGCVSAQQQQPPEQESPS